MFENAKFGDKFITKKKQQALVVGNLEEEHIVYLLTDGGVYYWANYDGMPLNKDLSIDTEDILQLQIVSKYQEPIDEEELQKLAEEDALTTRVIKEYNYNMWYLVTETFKAGYKKAKCGIWDNLLHIDSKYKKSIDEEKLENLAVNFCGDAYLSNDKYDDEKFETALYEGFKAGYRKAKEELI